MARQPSTSAVQSALMPLFSDHLVKSAIRLVRQSTTVPNTSNTRAFTFGMSLIVSSLFSQAAEFVIARSTCDEAILLTAEPLDCFAFARNDGGSTKPSCTE